MSDITLYWGYGSRAYSTLWLLEELGVPYRSVLFDYHRGRPKPPGFDKLNPHGQSPTLTDGEAVISEAPAIALFLADRYGYGTLAPRIEEADRGAYLKWMVYSTAVFEAARGTKGIPYDQFNPRWSVGWRPIGEVVETVAAALDPGPWLLGDRFTAADVMLGSVIGISLFSGGIDPNATLQAYSDRAGARPAAQKAGQMNWPPKLFPPPAP